jgi:uncharacterized protein YegL
MKKGLTELVFILDRSGSMCGLEEDTIGGFNGLIEKQKNQDGEVIITTVLFDDRYELLHDRMNLNSISNMTDKEYYVRGSTALLDAIGKAVHKVSNVQKQTIESERAENVLFVITTDGRENASREYDIQKIRQLIKSQKTKFGWEFMFLGANIDALKTAENFGIDRDRAVNYKSDKRGTQLNYDVLGEAVSSLRSEKAIKDNWKERIEEDYKDRS